MRNKRRQIPTIFQNKNRRGQLTIFIIIAIVLVASVAGFFVLRSIVKVGKIPADMQPVYTSFLTCLEQETITGIDVLESQGGYISLPSFEPGSTYAPFSSQLDFLGNPIPYWYYISGNGIEKEQVPAKKDMEKELESFIENRIRGCGFEEYYEQGFVIKQGEPSAKVTVRENEVAVNLKMNFNINKAEQNAFVASHNVKVKANLGNLYDSAKKIYDYEQKTLFLEEYAVDALRLYAPVDGVEITCSPEIWSADEIFSNLKDAIEENTLALKVQGGDYSLLKAENKYFVADINPGNNVRFITSKDWASSFEVLPAEGNMLIAEPVGNQPGLGILGFCYVPYHFVYSMNYPVLVQVVSGDEIFQFPMAVVVQGNNPRSSLDASASEVENEMCDYKNSEIKVDVYDTNLNAVDASISFECFGTGCYIGETEAGSLKANFPQCVNGYIVATAEGFEDTRYLFSTTSSGSSSIIMNRLYKKTIDLKLDGSSYNGEAVIYFVSDNGAKTVAYPSQTSVELSEGNYEIQVYIYKESSMKFEKSSYEQCIDVPAGILGIAGIKRKECIDVEVPSQIVSQVLAGGGKQEYYITETELATSGLIEINAEALPTPDTIFELQDNYALFESKGLEVNFR